MPTRKILLLFACILCLTACEKSLPILPGELPDTAQTFVKQHFPESNIDFAIKDRDHLTVTYKAVLSSGYRLEFKRNGSCSEVDCRPHEVPQSILPTNILPYLQTHFPTNYVVEYELKSHGRVEVTLNNNIELLFNKTGQIIKMDD